MKVNFSCWKIW